MPNVPVVRLALAAWLATALLAAACGPGDPPSPESEDVAGGGDTPGDAGDAGGGDPGGGDAGAGGTAGEPDRGDDTAGGDAGGGRDPGDAGGGTGVGGDTGGGRGDDGVPTRWAIRSGGAGDEWVQDVAAAPGGAVVALTVVGPRGGGGFDQLGVVRLGPGGAEQLSRLYDVRTQVRFPADGALSVGPGGEIYVALAIQCGNGCPLGGAVNGSALVQLSSSGDPRWRAALPGDVASQPVVDPQGNVAVASASGGANVVRSYSPAGALRWERPLPGAAADVALASDAGSNILVGRGSEVTKLAPGGAVAWSRSVGADIAGLAGTGSQAVVVAGTTSQGPAVLVLGADGSDGAVQRVAGGDGVLVEVGAGRRVGVVTSAGGCGATMTTLDLEGAAGWSRTVAAAECDGSDISAHAVTVTTQGAVVVGGAVRGPVDLGRGRITPGRTDGFVASYGP